MEHKKDVLLSLGAVILTVIVTTWIMELRLPREARGAKPVKLVNVTDENGTAVFGANSANVAVTNFPAVPSRVTVEDESGNTVFGANSAKVEVTNFPAASGGSSVFTLFGVDACPGVSVILFLGDATYIKTNQPGGVFCNVGALVPGALDQLVVANLAKTWLTSVRK